MHVYLKKKGIGMAIFIEDRDNSNITIITLVHHVDLHWKPVQFNNILKPQITNFLCLNIG